MKRIHPLRPLFVALCALAALLLAHPFGAAATESPPDPLRAVWDRACEAGAYDFTADVEQTLIPRPIPAMIGQSDERVDIRMEGEVTLPDQARIELRLEGGGPNLPAVALVRDGAETYLLKDGERVPTENPAGLSTPTADYLSYLAAAENVKREDVKGETVNSPFTRHVSRFTFDINGARFAAYVRQQMEAELRESDQPLPPGVELSLSPVLQRMTGHAQLWVDADGLPVRQVMDLEMREATEAYDARAHVIVDFRFSEAARERIRSTGETSEASGPLRGLLVGDLGSTGVDVTPMDLCCLLFLVAMAGVLIVYRGRRWVYRVVAVGVSVILVTSPFLQALGVVQYQARQAHAAHADAFAEALDLPLAPIEPSLRQAQDESTNHPSPFTSRESALVQQSEPDQKCGDGSTSEDADGDGLTDADEYCLGTDPYYADSDRDLITDTVEIDGFDYGGRHWTSNPFLPDSNQDGLFDGAEWPQPVGQAPRLADADDWDPDGDGIPNLWDADNDGDGVPDDLDLSPFSRTTYSDTFSLATQGGGFDGYQYIEIQVQPEDIGHLRYNTGYLDWPYDDKGQTQDLDGSTEDIRLSPMLRIRTNQTPDEALAREYNTVVYEEDGGYTLYTAVSPVGDGGQMVAFYGKVAYGPDDLDDIRWESVELVWTVQLSNDAEAGGEVVTEMTTIGTQPEPFRVTGLQITKSRNFESAVLGTPAPAKEVADQDRDLFNLLLGLSNTYLTHQDPTLQEIESRFSQPNTPITDTWGVPARDVVVELPDAPYGHVDEAMSHLPTRLNDFLENNNYAHETNPSVVVAFQEEAGLHGLDDEGQFEHPPTFNLNLANVAMITSRGLKTSTCEHVDGAWQGLGVRETLSLMDQRFEDHLADILEELQQGGDYPDLTEEDLRGVVRMLYASWTMGQTRIISVDGVAVAGEGRADEDVFSMLHHDRDSLPAYLLEATDLGDPNAGLRIGDSQAQEWAYEREQESEGNEVGSVSMAASYITLDGEEFAYWFTGSRRIVGALLTLRGFAKAAGILQASKFCKRLGNVMTGLAIALTVGDFLVTLWGTGWDMSSPVAKRALVTAIVTIAIIVAMTVFSGILTGILGLVDLVLYFVTGGAFTLVGAFIEAVTSFIYEHEVLTEFEDVSFVGFDTEVMDKETGIVVGNRFRVSDECVGMVSRTSDGEFDDLEDSWVSGRYWGSATGATAVSKNGSMDCSIRGRTNICHDPVAVEFELDTAKRNVELEIRASAEAKTLYKECWVKICKTKATYTDLGDEWDPITLHLDVLPANLLDLWNWGEIITPDRDGDGLPNDREESLGTDPDNWDSDGDGLSDEFEHLSTEDLGTDPTAYDTDGDGLSDGLEYRLGTKIDAPDSDNDGLLDGDEVFHREGGAWTGGWEVDLPTRTAWVFSDPLVADVDGDGLNDRSERNEATSPYAYNDAPRLSLTAGPLVERVNGAIGAYLEPGERLVMDIALDSTGPHAVTSTLKLCLPDFFTSIEAEGAMSGDRNPSTEGATSCNGRQWSFAAPYALLETESANTTVTATVDSGLGASTSGEISVTLPYRMAGVEEDVVDQVAVTVDVDDPQVAVSAPVSGTLLGGGISNYVVGGSASDQSSWVTQVQVDVPGQGWVDAEGISPWATTWELPEDGRYTLQARAYDYVGRVGSSDQVSVTVDNTPPTVTLDLASGEVVSGTSGPGDRQTITVTLSGDAGDNLVGLRRVQISTDGRPWQEVWSDDGAPLTVNWNTTWTLPNEASAQGEHTVEVRAFDRAGNRSETLMRTILVDVVPPTSELTDRRYLEDPPPHVVADQPINLYGVTNDAGRVPEPSRPVELVGELDAIDDATMWLELTTVDDDDQGVSVTWLGDFNGDRMSDFAVGLPAARGGDGEVTVVYGRAGGWPVPTDAELLAESRTSLVGADDAGIGATLAAAGDVNGDGFDDLLVGDAQNDRAFLVFGRPGVLGRDQALEGDRHGYWSVIDLTGLGDLSALAAAGDVNGDGLADLLIGVTGAEGKAYLLLGEANPWAKTVPLGRRAAAQVATDPAGAILSGVGDMDGDQLDEFAVAHGGTVYLFEGRETFSPGVEEPGETLTTTQHAVATFDSSDSAPELAALGDVNGDALADFIYADGDQPTVVFGDAGRAWPIQALDFTPEPSGFLAAPGDVDADGLADVLVRNADGDAYLVLGADLGSVQATLTDVRAAATAPYATGSDLNSDGSSDLLLVPDELGVGLASALDYGPLPHVDPEDLPVVRVSESASQQISEAAGLQIQANTYTVDDDGGADFTSIQDAVGAAGNGDTINVEPGAYDSFTVDGVNDLTISGVHPDAVFVDGGNGAFAVKVQNAEGVRLENLTLRSAQNALALDGAGVGGYDDVDKKTVLERVLVYDFTQHAVSMDRTSSLRLTRCTLAGGDDHIHLEGGPDPAMDAAWSTVSTDAETATSADGGLFADGENVYLVDDSGTIDAYSVETGLWGSIPDAPAAVQAAATADESGRLWALRRDPATGFDGPVYAIAYVSEDEIYVGGDFQHVGDVAVPYVAAWNGSAWEAPVDVGQPPDGAVYALLVDGDGLYAGGTFGLRHLPAGGSFWENWGDIASGGAIRTMVFHGGWIVVGGTFDDIGGVSAHKIARREGDGAWYRIADPPSDTCNGILSSGRHVSALEQGDDYILYLGGRFHVVGAEAFGTDGCRDPAEYGLAKTSGTWIAGTPRKSDLRKGSDIYAFDFYAGDDLVVGGDIDNVKCFYTDGCYDRGGGGCWWPEGNWCSAGGSASNLAIFADKEWRVPGYLEANAPVRTLEVAGNHLYVGGDFTQVGGSTGALHVATYDTFPDAGGSWHTLGDGVNGSVRALIHQGGDTYIGGAFTLAGEEPALHFAHWDGGQWVGLSQQSLYEYDGSTWHERAVLPQFVGDGASIVSDGDGHLYAIGGSGSAELYRYTISSDAWEERASAPAGLGAGGGLTWADDTLYALRGGDTGDLDRYDPAADDWEVRASIPVTGPVVGAGGGVAWDGGDWLYVLAGGNGKDFLRYHIPTDSWETLQETPDQVVEGGGLVRVGRKLFGVPGGGQKLWQHAPVGIYPEKLTLDHVALSAPETASSADWINLADLVTWPDDFVVGGNSNSWIGRRGVAWSPPPILYSSVQLTHDEARFLDPDRDVYRLDTGTILDGGYHAYRTDAMVGDGEAFNSIQDAIDSGANRVQLRPGTYEQTFYLMSGVEVGGNGADLTIVEPPAGSSEPAMVRAEGVVGAKLSMLTLNGDGSGVDGLLVEDGAQSITLERAIIRGASTAISATGEATNLEVVNNTVVSNTNGFAAAGCAPVDVRNTVFAHNADTGLRYDDGCTTRKLHKYNIYWQNGTDLDPENPGPGELFLDPLFVDPGPPSHDYHTQDASPVIDAGDPGDPPPPGAGGRVDIGYIEQNRAAIYVDDDYCEDCVNDGLSWQVDAFDVIQDGLDQADGNMRNLQGLGYTVGVAPGTYTETITIPSHVRLVGSGAEETTIDAQGVGPPVTFDAVAQSEISGLTITGCSGTAGITVTGASNGVTIVRNIINGCDVGVGFSGRSSGLVSFNTVALPEDKTAVLSSGPGTWATVENNVLHNTGHRVSYLRVEDSGQILSDYNLRGPSGSVAYYSNVDRGPNDVCDNDAGFTSGYRIGAGSPARDAASPFAEVAPGGGERSDMGYYELTAAPLPVFLGREDVSSATGNSGVGQVEVGFTQVGDPADPVTATVPGAWTAVMLDSPQEAVSFWDASYTPAADSLYRFYSRAGDVAGNREEEAYEEDWYDGAFVADGISPVVTWTLPVDSDVVSTPLQLRAEAYDYDATGAFSVDDVWFEVDGVEYDAEWAADPWDEEGQEPRTFRAWVALDEGSYTDVGAFAVDKAGNVMSDTRSLQVSGSAGTDMVSPTLVVSSPTEGEWFTGTVVFSGTVTDDDSGVAAVEVSLDGGYAWLPGTVDGQDWELTWEPPEDQAYVSFPAQVRARDQAGNSDMVSRVFTVDSVPPTGPSVADFTAFVGPVERDAKPGTHFDIPVDLRVTWQKPFDGSGVADTLIAVDKVSDTLPTTNLGAVTSYTHGLNTPGDWYVHLAVQDLPGNQSIRHYGPWHVGTFSDTSKSFNDRVQTIVMDGRINMDDWWEIAPDLLEWGIGDFMDDFQRRGTDADWWGPQELFATWDGSDVYWGWSGAWWTLDGEMWTYLDAGDGGCSEPVTAIPTCQTLPFEADHAISISGPVSGTLWTCSSGSWQEDIGADWEFAHGEGGDTEVRIDWLDVLSSGKWPTMTVDSVDVGMIAYAVDDDGTPWAVFPTTNPLTDVCSEGYSWIDLYDPTRLFSFTVPSKGQPKGIDVGMSLDSVQAPQAAWCPGSDLGYVFELANQEVFTTPALDLALEPGAGLNYKGVAGAIHKGGWDFEIPSLPPGAEHRVTVTGTLATNVCDLAGSAPMSLSVELLAAPAVTLDLAHRLDCQPPTLTVTTDPAKTIRPVIGTASDGNGSGVGAVDYRIDGGGWQPASGTLFWSADLALPEKTDWQVDVRAIDQCGLEDVTSLQFSDTTPPTVTLDVPSAVSVGPVDIDGTARDLPLGGEVITAEVQIDGGGWQLASLGAPDGNGLQQWQLPWNPSVSGVTHTLRARATDVAHNVGYAGPVDVHVGTPPTADAGDDQCADPGDEVALHGSGSFHPDGEPLTYGWKQTGGPSVTLSDAGAVSPTFTAPGTAGPITFTLTVTDNWGLNDTDVTVVTVRNPDLALEKRVSDYTPRSGESIVYTVTVTNGNPGDAVGVVVTDALPSGVSYLSDDSGNYDEGSGFWSVPCLAGGGGTTHLGITAQVDAVTPGTLITNTAVISPSGWVDPDSENGADHAVIAAQHPDAVIITVTPEDGGTLIAVDDQGYTTTVEIPAGAVTDTLTLILTPLDGPTHPTVPFLFAGHAFLLEIYKGPYVQPGYVFKEPISITLHYSDEDVAGLDEAVLALYVWTGGTWEDAACNGYERHPAENWLAVEICHLSQFALLGQGQPVAVGGSTLAMAPSTSLWQRTLLIIPVMLAALAAAVVLTVRRR